MPESALGPVSVPLTFGQRVRLLRECWPLIAFALMVAGGTLRLIPKAHFQNSPGSRYRVVYSPVSKIVWALEPPERRSY